MESKGISSLQNPTIKQILQLQNKKAARKKEGLFVVEGIKSIQEIPQYDQVRYFVSTSELAEYPIPARDKKKSIIVTPTVYNAISDTKTPQGIMAVVEIPERSLESIPSKDQDFYLVLENIQDPGNMGTIIRTAHAFGVKNIFITKGSVDLYSPKVIRATMGSLFHVNAYTDYEAEEYISYLKEQHIPIYVTALEEDAKPIFEIPFRRAGALVIGNEGSGVSERMKKAADYKMIIPMPGGSESLNASVAASICIYEMMRYAALKPS